MISDRKRKIIKAVVDDYIESALPVSSKSLAEKHLPECSPATIRNELSTLESMGYLVQPHVSAGRIPSQKAFRLYVDELLDIQPMSAVEIKALEEYFSEHIGNVEMITQRVAKVLSEITNYTSVIIKSKTFSEIIEKITLLKLNAKSALVVIVTDINVLKDNIIPLPPNMDDKSIDEANIWLNKVFAGKVLSDFCDGERIENDVAEGFAVYRELFFKILEILRKINSERGDIITEGGSRILQYPEYSDADKAHAFLTSLESKETVEKMFSQENETDDLVIKIGEEDKMPEDCAVVSKNINVGGRSIASAGVIGPVRMDYKKVISVLDQINRLIANVMDDGEDA